MVLNNKLLMFFSVLFIFSLFPFFSVCVRNDLTFVTDTAKKA